MPSLMTVTHKNPPCPHGVLKPDSPDDRINPGEEKGVVPPAQEGLHYLPFRLPEAGRQEEADL